MNKKRFFNKYPKVSLFTFVFVIFLLTDVACKNVIKSYWKMKLSSNNHEKVYRIPSHVYHHDLKPNVSIPATVWGNVIYPIATNSLGFKDRAPREIPLVGDNYRVLFLGDSFTEGIGVPYEKTFVGLFAAQYAEKGVDVLNASAASYSPSIYYAKVKHLLDSTHLSFDELVVFVDIVDIQDDAVRYKLDGDVVRERTTERDNDRVFQEKFEGREKSGRSFYRKLERLLARDTIVTHYVIGGIHDTFWGRDMAYEYAVNIRGALWTIDNDIFDQFGRSGLDQTRIAMDRLALLCRERGIRLTLGVYPIPDQIFHNDLNSLQVQFWSKWATKNGVGFINLFPEFCLQPYGKANVKRILDTYFIAGDTHWNDKGHARVAEHLLKVYVPAKSK